MKSPLRDQAISLRKRGLSYTEIQQHIRVSRSSLSLWLRNIELNQSLKKRIDMKRIEGIQRGMTTRVLNARTKREKLVQAARSNITSISLRELWLLGITLYWAEGTKQRVNSPSQRIAFNNSDPDMLKIFLVWLIKCANISLKEIFFEIYIHESMIDQKQRIIAFWSEVFSLPTENFDRIYIKRNVVRKQYFSKQYHGLVRIGVKKSTDLNRKILGWQQGIIDSCRVV